MKTLVTILGIFTVCLCSGAKADDSWRYPKLSPGLSGSTDINKESIATYWSRDIDESFDTIVNWYAKKLNAKGLTKALEQYLNRSDDAPDISHGSVKATVITSVPDSSSSTTITYFLTPNHKHVTIFHPTVNGEVIVLSIAGTPKRTSVQFVAKQATRKRQ